MSSTSFYGSQLGGKTVINYAYTDSPWKLMRWDIYYFLQFAWALPSIVLPVTPADSGELDELAFTRQNLFCIAIHIILCVLQIAFLLSIPFAFVLPAYLCALVIAIFLLVNWGLSMLLNGDGVEFTSDPKYTPDADKYANEQWVFLNGVAVGEHWLKNNLNRLALTFKRPVLGIHNRTTGIIFDVIECLIQRNFGYATNDIRVCYRILKEKLYNPQFSKVVFILHSQGGIEGGMVLDWLLQELPQDLLAKLEVYTFGNASNHFNNPHRFIESQDEAFDKPAAAAIDATHGEQNGEAADGSLSNREGHEHGSAPLSGVSNARSRALRIVTETSSIHPSAVSGRAIGHVEHYAHTTDFVAIWGVLHFATAARSSPTISRFIGRVFARTSPRGGHQFCQHYLDGMFPLERDAKTGELVGCAEEGNEFMESEITAGREGDESAGLDAAYDGCWLEDALGESPAMVSRDVNDVEIHGETPTVSRQGTVSKVKVKDLSRLWLYRNGKVPDEKPPLLRRQPNGVVRGATL